MDSIYESRERLMLLLQRFANSEERSLISLFHTRRTASLSTISSVLQKSHPIWHDTMASVMEHFLESVEISQRIDLSDSGMRYNVALWSDHLFFLADSMMRTTKKRPVSVNWSVMTLKKHLLKWTSSSHRPHRPSHGRSGQSEMIRFLSISKMSSLSPHRLRASHDSWCLLDSLRQKTMHPLNCLSDSRYLVQSSEKRSASWLEMFSRIHWKRKLGPRSRRCFNFKSDFKCLYLPEVLFITFSTLLKEEENLHSFLRNICRIFSLILIFHFKLKNWYNYHFVHGWRSKGHNIYFSFV